MADRSTRNEAAGNADTGVCRARCNFCGSGAPLIWVHGHGQCADCGVNVEECCQGETSPDARDRFGRSNR